MTSSEKYFSPHSSHSSQGTFLIIIKNVPCEECEECGEKYFSDEVMSRLEKIVEKAREIASEVYVTDYNNKVA